MTTSYEVSGESRDCKKEARAQHLHLCTRKFCFNPPVKIPIVCKRCIFLHSSPRRDKMKAIRQEEKAKDSHHSFQPEACQRKRNNNVPFVKAVMNNLGYLY